MPERYFAFATRMGQCLLRFGDQPFRLWRIFLPGADSALPAIPLESVADTGHPARRVARAITGFFDGKRPPAIPEAWLDWRPLTEKERRVLQTVAGIPYGQTRTYGQIADQAGFPGGARFVGNTMAKNPFPVIVPCHRVIRADGSPGGFAGGLRPNRQTPALEGRPAGPSPEEA